MTVVGSFETRGVFITFRILFPFTSRIKLGKCCFFPVVLYLLFVLYLYAEQFFDNLIEYRSRMTQPQSSRKSLPRIKRNLQFSILQDWSCSRIHLKELVKYKTNNNRFQEHKGIDWYLIDPKTISNNSMLRRRQFHREIHQLIAWISVSYYIQIWDVQA